MRRATAKSTERNSATESGFQCRLGLPSAWSQPETRRTTLVRSHSHTSAISPIPLLPRVPRSLSYPTSRYSHLARTRLPSFSLVYRTVPNSARFFRCDRKMRAGAICGLVRQVVGSFEIRFAISLLLCPEKVNIFAIRLLSALDGILQYS